MKKAEKKEDDEMRPEYGFSAGSRNPYAARYSRGSNIVMVRPKIFAAFPSEEAVNEGLRQVLHAGLRAQFVKPVSAKSKQSKAG